ncbi:MAG: hypothetical protein NTX81_04480 [Candidatus Bathyarchaeota archaeon]|jgi:hypothetical protein|nr:hypothetical protein [Candidatus Bathyarchaeota archaeon]
MPKALNLSKYSVYRVIGNTDYASNDALTESLKAMSVVWNIPINRYLRDLLERTVDSISFTKDKPYCYFFARRLEKSLSITIKEAEKIIELSVPLGEVEKILMA